MGFCDRSSVGRISGSTVIPGYVTWNVRGGYDFGAQLSNLKVGAGVKNIFDKQYFTRSSDNNSGMYVGAPRTFFVQASVGF
jgi:Fe(3+) dicitrate transport protein